MKRTLLAVDQVDSPSGRLVGLIKMKKPLEHRFVAKITIYCPGKGTDLNVQSRLVSASLPSSGVVLGLLGG